MTSLKRHSANSHLGKRDVLLLEGDDLLRKGYSYAEIRDLYVGQLAHVWVTDSTETTRTNVEKKIDSFAQGDLPHATEMLRALWKTANKEEPIEAPSNVSSKASPFFCVASSRYAKVLTSRIQPDQVPSRAAQWGSLKTALMRSIRTGVFFDRKYWARNFKKGDVLKPVYFSSTIMDDKTHQLNKCTSKLVYGSTKPLSVVSGQIPQEEKHLSQ